MKSSNASVYLLEWVLLVQWFTSSQVYKFTSSPVYKFTSSIKTLSTCIATFSEQVNL